MDQKQIILAGNPNTGKTTLFNMLTGVRQHVGNYPGVTVEQRSGRFSHNNTPINLTDLPGIYALSSYSPEEEVAAEVLQGDHIDHIINIVDGANLEKNLYLTLQLLELGRPTTLFINMKDLALKKGISINEKILSEQLGIPVTPGVARKKEGLTELIDLILTTAEIPRTPRYDSDLEEMISEMKRALPEATRRELIAILEGDKKLLVQQSETVITIVEGVLNKIEIHYNTTTPKLMVQQRKKLIESIVSTSMRQKSELKESITRKIDAVVLHPTLALPIFFGILYLLFQLVFTAGEPLMGYIESGTELLGGWVSGFWAPGSESLLKSLLVDGIIAGVGGVLVFTPNIFLMFLGIALLEDSGYMARVAVIMDRIMGKVGLNGHSFLPMMMGFGCSIPAIMGARVVRNRWERLTTILVTPFISCGARLPVYLLIVSAFVAPAYQAITLWSIYAVGIALAFIIARLLRRFTLKGAQEPLLIELPTYLLPAIRSIALHTWDRGKHFIIKAGTVILAISILLWVITTFPRYTPPAGHNMSEVELKEATLKYSIMGQIGEAIEPGVKLMGGDWRVGSAFVAAAAAKEVFVSQMGILFALGDEVDESSTTLQDKLKATYTLPAALAFLLFILLSMPCIATFAIVKSETQSWRWPIFQMVAMTLLAFIISVSVYQIGTLIQRLV